MITVFNREEREERAREQHAYEVAQVRRGCRICGNDRGWPMRCESCFGQFCPRDLFAHKHHGEVDR